MKKTSLLLLYSLAMLVSHAQSPQDGELTIIYQDYEQAKQASQAQDKLLLIDFYTSWCVPCKELDALVFKDAAATREIAKNFVLLKYNAEKDSTHQLSLKYHINSYPTLLILNNNQHVVSRAYGVPGEKEVLKQNALDFLQKGIALDANKEYIKGVSNENHLAYPSFYKEYVYRTNIKNEKENLEKYWAANTDYLDEVSFAVLCYFTGGTPTVNAFFLANRQKYEALYGKQDVLFIITMLANKQAFEALGKKDRVLFEEAMQFARQHLEPKSAVAHVQFMEEMMLVAENRWPAATELFAVRKQQMNLSDESINRYCWSAWQKCDDKGVLQQCAQWMQVITEKTPNYQFLDTYSRLLYKSGRKQEGIDAMKKGIALGKQTGEDIRASEKWLQENQATGQ